MRSTIHKSVCGGSSLRRAALALVAAWPVLSGCSSTEVVPARPRDPIVGDQGGQWEAVLLPVSTREAVDAALQGTEAGRRDASLSVRGPRVLLAATQWPEPERATLERPRRIWLARDARDLLFFRPREPRHHHLPVYDGHAEPSHLGP